MGLSEKRRGRKAFPSREESVFKKQRLPMYIWRPAWKMTREQWEGPLVGPWSGDGGKVRPFSFSEKCPPQTRSFRRPYVKRQKGNCYGHSREEAPGPGLGCRTQRLQRAQSENSRWAQWEIRRSGVSRPVCTGAFCGWYGGRAVNLKALPAKDGQG